MRGQARLALFVIDPEEAMKRSSFAPSRLVRVVAMAAAVVFIGTACSGGHSTATSDRAQSRSATPVEGGALVYGLDAETPQGYCDWNAQLAASGIIVNQAIYDTLMVPNDKGDMVPYLAQSVTHSPDYLTWTITVRPDIQFQDGEPLDATAVKLNFDAYRKGALFGFVFQNIADEAVAGAMTVNITMKKPWIAFSSYLFATGRLGMVAPKSINAPDCPTHPIGTGPFMVKDYVTNDHLTVIKNPRYWRKDATGRQLPYLDQITFRPIIDPSARLNALKNGQIQLMLTDNGDITYQVRKAVNTGQLVDVENQRSTEIEYTMLRVDKAPFDDPVARQAVAYATNRDEINQLIYHGILTPTDTPFAPDVFAYLKEPVQPRVRFDLNRAKQLVAQYKTAHGGQFTVTLSSSNDPTVVRNAQLVQSQWQTAGIDVKLRNADQATLINQAISGDFQAVLWRNHPGADPDTQYGWWYSGSPINFGKINDPHINHDLDDARSNTVVTARQADYQDLQRVFASQLYNLWGFYALWTFASAPNVHGITGPDLPDGGHPGIVVSVHPIVGLWLSK